MWTLLGCFLLAAAAAGAAPEPPPAFAACASQDGPPPVRLTSEHLLATARLLARENESRLARIDSLLSAGAFGPPLDTAARRRAQVAARTSLRNVYTLLFRYADDPQHVYEAGEADLVELYRRFCESGLFPLARLKRVRMGRGSVCVQYDLSHAAAGVTVLGGRTLPFRVQERSVDGVVRRLLVVDWPSGAVGTTQVMLTEQYSFRVAHVRSPGPPAPYELYLAEGIEGVWLRRWGVHRPAAFMFWTSAAEGEGSSLLTSPLVGIRIYIPALKLELPLLLPDIDFDDLRALELPVPILDVDYVRQARQPAWLAAGNNLSFRDWQGVGPVPAQVRARFPNR